MKYIFSILCLSLVSCFSSCNLFSEDYEPKTELEKLPPLTTTGENTFGCLVNGEAIAITSSLKLTAIYQGGGVQLGAGGVYMIALDPFIVDTSYTFMDIGSGTSRAKYTKEVEEGAFCFYEYEDTYEGSITFSKIDRTNFIISGIFEFSTVTSGCDTIRVTEGRFDVQYVP